MGGKKEEKKKKIKEMKREEKTRKEKREKKENKKGKFTYGQGGSSSCEKNLMLGCHVFCL